jgi:HAD superfamily hydrolase (TIGR01458 family)
LTSASSAADLVRRRYPGQSCYVLASPLALPEFADIPLSDGPDARVVVVGDAEEGFTWSAMNHAFRLLHNGAAFVATHRGRWWQTADGPTIDAGAFISGLEYAAGVRATVAGKPSAPFFRAGFRALGLPPSAVLMVGDDIHHDVLPAMRLGARGALVRTGKYREGDLAAGTPDLLLESVAALRAIHGR